MLGKILPELSVHIERAVIDVTQAEFGLKVRPP